MLVPGPAKNTKNRALDNGSATGYMKLGLTMSKLVAGRLGLWDWLETHQDVTESFH